MEDQIRVSRRRAAQLLLVSLLGSAVQAEDPAPGCCGPCICVFCVQPPLPELAQRLMSSSSELFFGTVVAEQLVSCCDSRAEVTFRVLRRWQGADVPQVHIRTQSCTAIFPFLLGRQYLVAAGKGGEDIAVIDKCFVPIEGEGAAHSTMAALDKLSRDGRQR